MSSTPSAPGQLSPESALRGLIVDWGGVLTSSVPDTMNAWADEEDVDLTQFGEIMGDWLGREAQAEAWVNPVHALERGEMEVPHFESKLADALAQRLGKPVDPAGLLTRLFKNFTHAHDMTALVRRAHGAGIKTALLSNSWGNSYPDHLFDGMFDVAVISGDVGMRKPDAEIYHYTLELLDLKAQQCVFIDDMRHNVSAAVDLGIVGIRHESYGQTAMELDALFGITLSS